MPDPSNDSGDGQDPIESVAAHEAGHAIASHVLGWAPHTLEMYYCGADSRDIEGFVLHTGPAPVSVGRWDDSTCVDGISIALAGRAGAERIDGTPPPMDRDASLDRDLSVVEFWIGNLSRDAAAAGRDAIVAEGLSRARILVASHSTAHWSLANEVCQQFVFETLRRQRHARVRIKAQAFDALLRLAMRRY